MGKETSKGIIHYTGALAIKAGEKIMEVYSREFGVQYKEDSSPLTDADLASHRVIEDGLLAFTPDIPVVSEEGAQVTYSVRRSFERFWLVDPLDGTKEFVRRNGEFTVNIALIERNAPVLGVIYVPAHGVLYYGEKGFGAFRQEREGRPVRLKRKLLAPGSPLRVIVSRSHPSPEVEEFLKAHNAVSSVKAGSSLKFCLVAEGSADLYPRFSQTSEWDTAAGHAIAEAAGCTVTTHEGSPLTYNKMALLNPGFVVSAVSKG